MRLVETVYVYVKKRLADGLGHGEKIRVLIPSREDFKALEAELRLGRTCGRSPFTENNG